MRKAHSVDEILNKKFEEIPFDGEWEKSFGTPEKSGVWIIWGHSGNGKTGLAMQTAKELTKYTKSKVAYASMEEKARKTMQMALVRFDMKSVKKKFIVLSDNMEELKERLRKQKSQTSLLLILTSIVDFQSVSISL